MSEQRAKSTPVDGGANAAQPNRLQREFVSLYERLSKTKRGSDDHKQILLEIESAKDRMDAHRQLFCALMDANDRERCSQMDESLSIVENRIHGQINELLDKDLTFTEMMRLCRLINAQIKQVQGRLRKP